MTVWSVYNTKSGQILTSSEGENTWDTWQQANDVLNEDFSEGDNLEIALVMLAEE